MCPRIKLRRAKWLLSLGVVIGLAQAAHADVIPYSAIGTPNAVTYTFQAASTGDVTAYFTGSGAAYDEALGLLVNGTLSSSGFGLDDHTSAIGQSFDLGHVNAGDALVFALNVVSPSLGMLYSDPARNVAYDANGSDGHNHIYSTAYTASSPTLGGIPTGTYVAFEDLPFPNSDFNYFDETYVVTNVTTNFPRTDIPETDTLMLLSTSLFCFGAVRLIRRRVPVAAWLQARSIAQA